MKVLWAILSVLLAAAVVAGVWISGAKERAAERGAVDFTADMVTAISEEWKPRQLTKRAEPGLIHAMASQGQSVEELFTIYSKLGAVVTSPTCTFKDTSQLGTGEKRYTTMTVTCDAQYEKGPATFLVTLRRPADTEDDWKVYYLKISSPGFGE